MLKESDKTTYGRRLLNPNLSYLAKKSITTQILGKSKKGSKCPYCGAINGPVKKGPGLMKILHEPFRGKKGTDPLVTEALGELKEATSKNRELSQILSPHALIMELNPLQVLDLFKRIPKSDIPLLGMTSENANPANLIISRVFVPPVCIRPSVVSETKAGTTEDDLTMKQSEILLINDVINKHMNTGGKIELIQEDWDFLQLHVSLYFNSEVSGIPLAMLVKLTNYSLYKNFLLTKSCAFFSTAEKINKRYCTTTKRQTRPFSWKFVGKTGRFFWTNRYFTGSKFNDSSGRCAGTCG